MPMSTISAPPASLRQPTLPPTLRTLSTCSLPNTYSAEITTVCKITRPPHAGPPQLTEQINPNSCRFIELPDHHGRQVRHQPRRTLSAPNAPSGHPPGQRKRSTRHSLGNLLSAQPSHGTLSAPRKISLPSGLSAPQLPESTIANTSLTGSISTIDWSPSISAGQQAQAAGAAFCREGVGGLLNGLVKYGVTRLLTNNPASLALTTAGAFAGGLTGAYAGAGLGRAIVADRFSKNQWALGAAGGTGALCGAAVGALGSVYAHFTTPINHVAVEQIASLVGAYGRDTSLQWLLKEIGPRVERSPTCASATAGFFVLAAELSGLHALAPFLPQQWGMPIKNVLTSALVDATDGATATLIRSQLPDAKFKTGTGKHSLPTSKASLAAKSFELTNASWLRNVGTTISQFIKLGWAFSGLTHIGGVHGASALAALTSTPFAFRGLLSNYVLPNNQKIIGYEAPLSADPGITPAKLDGIVAGLDSVAVVSDATPQQISSIA